MRDGGAGLTRRAMLSLLSTAAAVRPSVARAQRPSAPARVGWLSYLEDPDPILERLREGLRELGYVEGKSFVIVPRFAHGDFTRLPQLVEELAGERVDVVVARGPSSDYTKAIRARVPVVFIYSGDPVAAGFADSLGRPGRNMTGITMMALELSAKRMDVLKLADLLTVQPHLGRLEDRVRLRPDVLEQSQLIEQVGGAGLEHLAAELAVEVLVTLQHQDVGAPLGEEEAEHEAGRSAPHDAGIHGCRRHGVLAIRSSP